MKFGLSLLMLLTCLCCMTQEKMLTEPPRATGGLMQTPVIDGEIHPDELKYTAGMYGFCGRQRKLEKIMKLIPADARFNIGTDGQMLYIAVSCPTGPNGILQRARPGRGGMVFLDDSFEFVFVPNPDAKIPDIYHIALNNRGAYMTAARIANANSAWTPEFQYKGKIKDGRWTCEAAVPLHSIGIPKLKDGQEIGIRVCRNWRRMSRDFGGGKGLQSSWSQIRCAFFDSVSIPVFRFSTQAPVIQFLNLKKGKTPDLRVSLFNPTDHAMTLRTSYEHRPSSSQSISNQETLTLAAGEKRILQLPVSQITSGETVTTGFAVASADGKTVHYRRAFRWDLESPEIFAAADNPDKDRVALKYAYYPESDELFLQLDFTAADIKQLKQIKAELLDKSGSRIAETVMPAVKNHLSELLWRIPSLKEYTLKHNPDGIYRIRITAEGLPGMELVREFERKVFPWENNSLGKSDRLIPPFTPIQVKEHQVSVLLREHQLAQTGLWKQVTAKNMNLLADGGMRFEAVIDGKTHTAENGSLQFTQKSDTQATAESRWRAGSLEGHAVSVFDYDGMMKYTLELQPGSRPVQSLKLIIPLNEAQAYLFHACTDGLRFNYGGAVPKKTGRVWDSSQAARTDLQTSYVPYIWLGTEERGFCVFGENDRGWVSDPKVPAQELIRKNGQLELVLNLIARPTVLNAARRIELGFMAMPIKPMPKDWRRSAVWGTPAEAKPYLTYWMSFIGSAYCRGGVTDSDDYSPRENDLTLWKTFGQIRKTRQIPSGFLDRWCAGYRSSEKLNTYRSEVRYGLNLMKSAPENSVTFYTNTRGVRTDIPETRTFMDNWLREEFQGSRTPVYGSSKSYSVDPSETFRDYAVYWYRQMLSTGACDHIYWDDIFLASNFDRSSRSRGYVLADGRLQPSVGLFNMRELFRRTAVMQLEMNNTPQNMVHMTNTAIAPLLSFVQQNLDWEDNLGINPFQQRYTKEYIRAVSIGRQFGNLPGALGLVLSKGDPAKIAWCLRTGAGVTLTHEILWAKGAAAVDYWKNRIEMLKFGYGTADVKVWNYWDADYPVRIEGGDNSSILLTKGKEAILIVCDYENGGKYRVSLAEQQLGIHGIAEARNMETGELLPVDGHGVSFQLRKYDFISIRLALK